MEWEWESYRTCVDPALEILEQLHAELPQGPPRVMNPIFTTRLDLRFFKMFLWGLAYWEESEHDWHLLSIMSIVGCKLRQTTKEFKAQCHCGAYGEKITNWEKRSYHLEKRIKHLKRQVKEICFFLLGGTFTCKPCEHEDLFLKYARETVCFIDFILENLETLNSKVDLIASMKQQIGYILGKLKLFRKFAYLVNCWNSTTAKSLGELISHVRTWANRISSLACMYWIDEMDESLSSATRTMLSDLMHKTMAYTPKVIALYLDGLKATRYLKFEGAVVTQALQSYVDFLLEDLVIILKDDFEILHEGLIFLLSFAMDRPTEDLDDGNLILAQVDAIINEVPSFICSIHLDEVKDDNSKTIVCDFLQKIARAKARVRELYGLGPHSSQFNSPRTNVIGFLDSLLGKLKKMLEAIVNFIPFVKHQVEIVQDELVVLRPFLQNVIELQNEHEEIKDLWTRIINLVYNADYVIKLSPFIDVPIWYCIIFFSDIIEEIKLIKIKIEKVEDNQMYSNKNLVDEMQPSDALPPEDTTSRIEGVFVGFKEDVRSIMDYLIGHRKDLTVISISGMAGQGKTTLAKRVYSDRSIQYHFHKTVWCYVSKECNINELLVKILHDVSNIYVKMEIQDLIERLRKSLKGIRYLIVMDDIWDVDVWHKVERSFPNDYNGSRIMFTSRNHDLASQAKPNSISHCLPLFSKEESWELMREKLPSDYSGASPELLEIGKQIATYCNGLPLAVALIGSVLGRTEPRLDLWKQVLENSKLHIASEGCMHIIELSFEYLPDHLKPCFLYFGAFPRGENIDAKKLRLLWIAEGFIKENEMQYSNDLANEYLDDLICQNLVVVTKRSSIGGVKTCNVHDLIYDLCLEKILKENFLYSVDMNDVVDPCNFSLQKYDHHRLCIGKSRTFIKTTPTCTRNELPTSRVHSLLWSLLDSWEPTCKSISWFLKNFRVLTVLDLQLVFLYSFEFPEVILSIIHLRYLALRGSIYCIPLAIADLWNLETLIMGGDLKAPLPNTMWKMKSLRHVYLGECRLDLEGFEQDESFITSSCNIETLAKLILAYGSKTTEFLRKLPRLRKLCCHLTDEEFHPMWFSMFGSLSNMETLKIHYVNFFFGDPYYDNLPTFNFPDSLKKLTLSGLKLPWSAMSIIGKQLPNLQVLKLLYWACEGTTWDLEDGDFPKLRVLKLGSSYIEQINVSSCDNPFPCLEELIVFGCYNLDEIPSSFGNICTLKTIQVVRSSDKAKHSARTILEEQREMGNNSLQVVARILPAPAIDHNGNNCNKEEEEENDDDDDERDDTEDYEDVDEGGEDEDCENDDEEEEEEEEYDDDDDDDGEDAEDYEDDDERDEDEEYENDEEEEEYDDDDGEDVEDYEDEDEDEDEEYENDEEEDEYDDDEETQKNVGESEKLESTPI